jgi:glycerol-3-phosphate dehydrogenase
MAAQRVYDVVIIGGGVVGAATARALSRYQLATVLVERHREVGFGTSKSNSGIIHAGQHASPSSVKGPLEWSGNQAWVELHRQLGFGFAQVGELVVARRPEDLTMLQKLLAQGRDKGVPGLEMWNAERVRREEPNLTSDVIAALHAPTAGVINPYEAVLMLAEVARRNGVELATDSPVTAIDDEEGLLAVRTPRATFAGRFVINAAGLYSDEIAELAGVRTFTITPRKGEEYLLDKRLRGLVRHIIFPCPTPTTKGILVIPTVDGTIMVGPTAQLVDSKEDVATSAQGAAQIFASVRDLVPGISERDVIAEFAGLRAVADTEDFILGPTARKGFLNAAGIQSPGLTAAPSIAEILVGMLEDEGLELRERLDWVPTLPWPAHFADLPTDAQMRLAAHDPRYARLVCRCEHVTEAEVADAIQRGAETLDGLKFRTRAGMGRCQGGFCTWRLMELLARAEGIPVTAVTKRGGDSWIVCERDGAPTAAREEVAS